MYTHLSDRKRRMFLCYTLPQNLSPKPLSFKDKGFLQKTIKNFKEPLSLELEKKETGLYLKHIVKPLNFIFPQRNFPINFPGKNNKVPTVFQLWENHRGNYISSYKPYFSDQTFFPVWGPRLYISIQKTKLQKNYKPSQSSIFGKKNPREKENIPKNLFFPLYINGKNPNVYTRYLYDIEHIKNLNLQVLSSPNRLGKNPYMEKKKIALFYGQIAKKDFFFYKKTATILPGKFEDNIYTILESRVDVCIYRAGFTTTIAMARQLIRRGLIIHNGKPLSSTKILAKPGDIFSLKPSKNKENLLFSYNYTTKALYDFFSGHPLFSEGFKDKIYRKKIFSENPRKNLFSRQTPFPVYKPYLSGYFYPRFFFSSSLKTYKNQISLKFFLQNNGYNSRREILNVFCAKYLFCKTRSRNLFGEKRENGLDLKSSLYSKSIWGQKPLHLEVSYKTRSFIYLYRPQKNLSPLFFDFNLLKK